MFCPVPETKIDVVGRGGGINWLRKSNENTKIRLGVEVVNSFEA